MSIGILLSDSVTYVMLLDGGAGQPWRMTEHAHV